jgi:hypothetical protein
MSHPSFKDRGRPIGRFIEECGEALAAAGKSVRFGLECVNPLLPEDQQETNREWLTRELKDLKSAIKALETELESLSS